MSIWGRIYGTAFLWGPGKSLPCTSSTAQPRRFRSPQSSLRSLADSVLPRIQRKTRQPARHDCRHRRQGTRRCWADTRTARRPGRPGSPSTSHKRPAGHFGMIRSLKQRNSRRLLPNSACGLRLGTCMCLLAESRAAGTACKCLGSPAGTKNTHELCIRSSSPPRSQLGSHQCRRTAINTRKCLPHRSGTTQVMLRHMTRSLPLRRQSKALSHLSCPLRLHTRTAHPPPAAAPPSTPGRHPGWLWSISRTLGHGRPSRVLPH